MQLQPQPRSPALNLMAATPGRDTEPSHRRFTVLELGPLGEADGRVQRPLDGHRIWRERNGAGQRVGSLEFDGCERAVLFDQGRLTDLGLLHADDDGSRALAINDAGQVVGFGRCGGLEQAFIWQGGHMVPLGGLCSPLDDSPPLPLQSSRARDINRGGQVVGRAATDTRVFGFLWSFWDGLLDLGGLLGDSAWRVGDASHIDDSGRIRATAVRDGRWCDVLLLPLRAVDDARPV